MKINAKKGNLTLKYLPWPFINMNLVVFIQSRRIFSFNLHKIKIGTIFFYSKRFGLFGFCFKFSSQFWSYSKIVIFLISPSKDLEGFLPWVYIFGNSLAIRTSGVQYYTEPQGWSKCKKKYEILGVQSQLFFTY